MSDNDMSDPRNLLTTEAALQTARQRRIVLPGQLELNQGRPTFTGRITLEQFTELTVVHNRKWAEEAGESVDSVTQREIIDGHANGLATFMLQGLVEATISRLKGEPAGTDSLFEQLEQLQNKVGRSSHYGLPQITLVLAKEPDFEPISDTFVRLVLPAGRLFVVADGQHRREAARRVREFLTQIILDRRIPKSAKFYPTQTDPISYAELEGWTAVQETFRSWTVISFEAHLGLNVEQARQMFTNYNCNVKPVKADLNLEFDQTNPINQFAKKWVIPQVREHSEGNSIFDLRQLATIHGFLFLGKTTIKSAPYNATEMEPVAQEFWTTILGSKEWNRPGSLIREVPVLKGLAKAWFYVFLAKRNNRLEKAVRVRKYTRESVFDESWVKSVEGLGSHTVPADNDVGFRFSPAHNDIVGAIVADVFSDRANSVAG
ncbi:MAG: hypothetical protein DMF63_12600 [Acidobacteria bacterium]|nr:MAG: hypothetical protein DMF63_12600 [Acidobacteriota bacterium]